MPARSFSSAEDDDFPAETIQGLDEVGAFLPASGREGGSGIGSGGDADAEPGFEPQPDGETYWALSRTPLTSLAFTLP
ncbi:MAG: hypothetical protein ACKOEM_13310, partial [Planctomycetia bacterium]